MIRLTTLLIIVGILSAGVVHAGEHSALSSVFTLDTQDMTPPAGSEHSALSNGFILDTRDLSADVDGSGIVDIPDLVMVALAFGVPEPGSNVDLNGDGVVNIADLVIVATQLGEVVTP